jgi:hypothetical protein
MAKCGYIFAALVMVVVGAGAAAPGGTPGVGPDTRGSGVLEGQVVKGNVSIQLPKGWVNAGGQALIAAQPAGTDNDASGQFRASLTINVGTGNRVDAAGAQAAQAKQWPGYVAVEKPGPVTVGGMQGVMFGGKFKLGSLELRSRQYMFAVGGQVYTITFTCLNSKWAGYQEMVEASVGTFAVKR